VKHGIKFDKSGEPVKMSKKDMQLKMVNVLDNLYNFKDQLNGAEMTI